MIGKRKPLSWKVEVFYKSCMTAELDRAPSLVLIDDDELIHATWKMIAKIRGHSIVCFYNLQQFQAAEISKETPVYVDFYLTEDMSGADVIHKLHAWGYQKLFITTGSSKKDLPSFNIVSDVLGKEYPSI
jgi:ActR/RegA family two-component response regulator